METRMGRKSAYRIGQVFGGLEILEILKSDGAGNHAKLKCLCHYCKKETIKSAGNIKRRNSCGCQQRNSSEWKNSGPKNKPWQLSSGQSAKNSLEYQYKRGADKRKLEYKLTTDQFTKLVTGECLYCGDSLSSKVKGQGKTSGDFLYTGIDRIDSEVGYLIENCVSCCWMCNNMKNKHSVDDFLNHISKIYKHSKEQ